MACNITSFRNVFRMAISSIETLSMYMLPNKYFFIAREKFVFRPISSGKVFRTAYTLLVHALNKRVLSKLIQTGYKPMGM